MNIYVWIVLLLGLTYSLYSDLKDREVSIYNLSLIFLSGGFLGFIDSDIDFFLMNTGLNLLFLGIQYGVLMLYLQLRYKEGKDIFAKWVGLGDLLFFIAISPLYNFQKFVPIYLGCLSLTLCLFLVFKSKLKTIPLAGLSALFIILFECYQWI